MNRAAKQLTAASEIGIGPLNSVARNMTRRPRGIAGYMADGGEASVVRLGGRRTKNTPMPVNAPEGRQPLTLTREDQGLLVDFMPIAGDIKGGVEGAEFISEELKREKPNYLLMGIVGGAAVLGVIPFAGDAAQKMIMRGARNFRKNRVTEDTLEMLSEQDAQVVRDLTDKTPVSELTESQRLADEIASDLRAGNIDAVTDTRLEGLDFKGDIRLRQHYIDGNVGTDADGVPITLDNNARMDRARSQGYDPDSPVYHGSNSEIITADPDKGKYRSSNTGVFTTDVPDVADAYIRRVVREEGFNQDLDGRMYPLLARNTDQGWDVDVQGGNWNNITRDTPALNRRTNAPDQTAYDAFPELFDRKMPPDRPPDVRSTNDLAREARLAGDARINFLNMSDRGGQYKRWDGETPEAANIREKTAGLPSNVRVDFDGANLRAPTAIFDQRLTHLKNIGMADGGAVMNGIGTLNETARNMTRGPRGIGAYQQFAMGGEASGPPPMRGPDPQGIGAFQQYADGGPVYMSRGGAPDEITARQASQEDLANLAKMVRETYGFDPVSVALEQGVDPELALRVMYEESKGKQSAGSEKGARGLMQLMPGTAEELGVDINDALDNYTGGLKYLKQMTNQFGLEVGLAAYNAGPGNVEEYQGVPPFKETQNYLRIIAEPFTGNSVEDLLNTGAENFMMNQPVFNEEDVARGRGVRLLTRPPEIEFSAPLTSLLPQARPPMMQPPNSPPMMRPQNRPLALPEGQSMIEKYGLPGDMPQGGIISTIR